MALWVAASEAETVRIEGRTDRYGRETPPRRTRVPGGVLHAVEDLQRLTACHLPIEDLEVFRHEAWHRQPGGCCPTCAAAVAVPPR